MRTDRQTGGGSDINSCSAELRTRLNLFLNFKACTRHMLITLAIGSLHKDNQRIRNERSFTYKHVEGGHHILKCVTKNALDRWVRACPDNYVDMTFSLQSCARQSNLKQGYFKFNWKHCFVFNNNVNVPLSSYSLCDLICTISDNENSHYTMTQNCTFGS
jgi:hypothetical protein